MALSIPFTGFPQEGLDFLSELAENNNKDWFTENKPRYIEHVQEPALSLVETLGQRLQAEFPNIRYDTAKNGSGSLMRINRDVRFSKDKSPYKTNVAMMFWEGAGKKMQHSAFGMQITPDGTGLMAGMFGFDKAMLQTYRDAVVHDTLGFELVEAIKGVESAGYEILGTHYKKSPRGYTMPDDDRAPYLLYNALYTHATDIPNEQVTQPEFIDLCMTHFKAMSPIQQWLAKIQA